MADYIDISLPGFSFAIGEPSVATFAITLPGLVLLELGAGDPASSIINITLHNLTAAIGMLAGGMGEVKAVLGWPAIDPLVISLRGAGHLNLNLPKPAIASSSISGNLIRIAAQLPVPYFGVPDISGIPVYTGVGASQENLGQIDITLPGVDGDVHVLSEVIGHIAGALPPFSFSSRTHVGSVGSISAELPLVFYDSVLLSEGLIQLDITLPCVLFDSTGSMEHASITYRTIAMNTMNFGVTEYGQLELKGMVDVFGKTIAINANQLIKIGHTLDNTEHISASFRTGTVDFSNPYWTRPRDIWITLRSGKKVKLTIKDNEVPANESSYESENFIENLKKTRVKIGRGFSAEFFDIQVENIEGELVDITNIHVHSDPVVGKKR